MPTLSPMGMCVTEAWPFSGGVHPTIRISLLSWQGKQPEDQCAGYQYKGMFSFTRNDWLWERACYV